LLLDCLLLFFSFVFAYWLVHRSYQTLMHFKVLTHTLLIYLVVCIFFFRVFRTYSGIVRYSSFVDLKKVGLANGCSMFVIWLLHYWMYNWDTTLFYKFSSIYIVVSFTLATVLMWGIRILVKSLFEITTAGGGAVPALIYGAMTGGVGLAKNIKTQKPTRFKLKGFISHDPKFKHNLLMGERVYTSEDDLAEVIDQKGIKAVLVSPLRNEDFRREQGMQDLFISKGVKMYMAGNAREWHADDDFNDVQLKEVSVEDLLPREQITVDLESVGRELEGKRILITGSAGSIGSEMVRQVASFKPKALMLIDQAETPQHDIRLMMSRTWPDLECETVVVSICKQDRMEEIFSRFRPEYVFHAAAYKHVPMMEDNPREAVQNNVYGTKVIADLSVKYGVKKFVMVSTDKAVNPTNVMGCSKRICEIYCQSLNWAKVNRSGDKLEGQPKCQFVTTRFGNVLGSNGSVIPLFTEQIKKGGPITVTHPDIIRFFMLIPEACKLVLEAGTKGKGGEIFVFDMGKPVKIADLAQRMIALSGAKNVEIKFTGLRPGEKLYEEVLNEQENTKPSFHKKIRIAQVREYEFVEVSKQIDELVSISHADDDMATVAKMKEIVPEYKSKNSMYETLDK
jgi:FlaA1/EpsC-like NDP-sugar epimerase